MADIRQVNEADLDWFGERDQQATDEYYNEIARRDFERAIYRRCAEEDALEAEEPPHAE